MTSEQRNVDEPGGHDLAVANAADAWLNNPQDFDVYWRVVEAVRRRRVWLYPTLGLAPPNPMDPPPPGPPERTDDLGADRPPVRLSEALESEEPGRG